MTLILLAHLEFTAVYGLNPKELVEATYTFSKITEEEVLFEPLFGCWEANMTHALERAPVDLCSVRNEEQIVLGNAGVVRVLSVGQAVKDLQAGDICMLFGSGSSDKYGFMVKAIGYDMPGSIGLLAKRSKTHYKSLIKLPENTKYSLQQWAAFSVRYVTAWANWQVAYGAFRLQIPKEEDSDLFILAWGGGVGLAQAFLAKFYGYDAAMVSSRADRLDFLKKHGIIPIERALDGDTKNNLLLENINQKAKGRSVSIIFDHIGGETYRTSLRILGRQGVIASAGWKTGMKLSYLRATECINRRFHIHTHYARLNEALAAMDFAEKNDWMPIVDDKNYTWNDIPLLSRDYEQDSLFTYFPIYGVND